MSATIFDVNFTKHEASSLLRVLTYANIYSPDDIQFTGDILLDGSVVQPCKVNIILDNRTSQGQMPMSPFAFVSGVSAGSHNIKLIVTNQESDNVSLVVKAGATIEITELKQAAH